MSPRVSSSGSAHAVDADIDLPHLGGCHHLPRLALGDLAAEIKHDQPADHGEQRVHDVLDPEDRRSRGMDLPDGLDQFVAFALGQSAGDLVEQQQTRPGCERARHFQPLAFEQRQRAGEGVGARDQMQALENLRAGRGGVALASCRRPWTAPTSRFSNTVSFSNGCGI